ncbi:cupin domain-containing protein [Pyxidicoccus fallax]|uniref:Cupin domain-containing protein n=1 Tax=Pyxidicoccus fallax TaxID=394095 RepID=A0A848LTG4_9BACT|nr:cupin domain-containing protein [Pyxidicoccus fallax]NMO21235.1 cupin domain-containing protein [Pyxidicoccus fallax]NPC84945.1 cupin domain-containing protein [Pyxidicoccus fallax]
MRDNNSKRAAPAVTAKSLETTYVHLRNNQSAADIEVTPTFWQELGAGKRPELDEGRTLMQFDFTEDWATWERHPAGDEVVVLLSGKADLILEVDGREQRVTLQKPGEFVSVPKGVWHTARTSTPCSMLFVTPGAGTENRPR